MSGGARKCKGCGTERRALFGSLCWDCRPRDLVEQIAAKYRRGVERAEERAAAEREREKEA